MAPRQGTGTITGSTSAAIVDAVRTRGGKRHGNLSGWHPVDLAAQVLSAVVERDHIDSETVDDVIMGCVQQVAHQAVNVGRSSVLAAGFPESVPATTIDRRRGSSQQSAHFAVQGVMAGAYDVVIAAGVEVMSTTPMGSLKHRAPMFLDPQSGTAMPHRAGLSGKASQQKSSSIDGTCLARISTSTAP
jgi:acetyl-CoA acetyltransferase